MVIYGAHRPGLGDTRDQERVSALIAEHIVHQLLCRLDHGAAPFLVTYSRSVDEPIEVLCADSVRANCSPHAVATAPITVLPCEAE